MTCVPQPAARRAVAAVLLLMASGWLAAQSVPAEPDPVVTASAVLDASLMSGPHHTVNSTVQTPGPYHVFTVTSPFGTFEAEGIASVATRIEEVNALAALAEVNRGAVFVKSAGTSLIRVGTGVVDAVTDPVDTAKGIGAGVKRFGVNLGRRTKRTVQRMRASDGSGGSDESLAEKTGDVAGSAAKSLLGVNSARRAWARRIGADPYTPNPVLKAALERVAMVDAAGGIATKFVVPIPTLVSTTADVGQLVWGRDPEELRKYNEQRVREMGTSESGAKAFFENFTYTLTMQTRIIAALSDVRVPGAADYLETAAEAEDYRDALFFVESAELLQRFHANSPVAAMLQDSRAVVVRMPQGQAVALLPFDWLRRSDDTVEEFRALGERATKDLQAVTRHVRVSGTITPAAAAALLTLGWRTD